MGLEIKQNRIRIVLIGCGDHANAILHTSLSLIDDFEVVGCCDLQDEKAGKVARRFGMQDYYTDLEEMLREVEADAALVVAPPNVQASLIKKCMLANLHVYTEKPVGIDLNSINEISRIAKERNLHVEVGFNKRFSPYYLKAKEAVSSDVFGHPSLFYAKFAGGYRHNTWDLLRVGSIHMFDLARFIVGDIEQVFGYMHEKSPGQVSISVNVLFKNGSVGLFLLSSLGFWSVKGGEYIEVRGDRNNITVENCRQLYWQKPTPVVDAQNRSSHQAVKEIPAPAEFLEPNYSNVSNIEMHSFYLNGYYNALKYFGDCISTNNKPLPGIDEGIEALKIAIAVQMSIEQGTPVKINNVTEMIV